MMTAKNLKLSLIICACLLTGIVFSVRLGAPAWMTLLLSFSLIAAIGATIGTGIQSFFHRLRLSRMEKWLLGHAAIGQLFDQGFKVIDDSFVEGEYKGYQIRIQYFKLIGLAEEVSESEYTGEKIVTTFEGIKFSLFAQYQEVGEDYSSLVKRSKKRFSLYGVDGHSPKLNWATQFNVFGFLDDELKRLNEARLIKQLDALISAAEELAFEPYLFSKDNQVNWKEFNEDMRTAMI